MLIVVIRMSFVWNRLLLVCHLCVTRMYSFIIHMSRVYHLYVTRMFSYIIRKFSYVICISLVCTRMSSVCHSYVVLPWTTFHGKTTYEWHTDDIRLHTKIIKIMLENYAFYLLHILLHYFFFIYFFDLLHIFVHKNGMEVTFF